MMGRDGRKQKYKKVRESQGNGIKVSPRIKNTPPRPLRVLSPNQSAVFISDY